MKIDRLVGIITTLQRNGKVTATYLAEKFEVSRRTVIRDIEDICLAGIPIVTSRGTGGGISIMDGFSLDTTVFTRDELSSILTGLKSLDSVSKSPVYSRLLGKLTGEGTDSIAPDNIMIDLASFYKDSLSEKIEIFKKAIANKKLVSFRYYYSKGEENKIIEPYIIVFKWSDWYIFGWSEDSKGFRLYKLNRLWELCLMDMLFEARNISEADMKWGSHISDDYFITAIYESSEKYKLVEEYGPSCFETMEDGRLYTRWGFTDPDTAAYEFLAHGDKVEIVEPAEMREKVRKLAESIAKKHK